MAGGDFAEEAGRIAKRFVEARADKRGLPDYPGVVPANLTDAYATLTQVDRVDAARLNPADTTRICRALEVVRSTGRPIAEWRRERVGGIGDRIVLVATILLPPRAWLN